MIIVVCMCIALLSILFLIGWFFHSVNEYQKQIDIEEGTDNE
jgi:hypothetical protein